MKDFTRYQLDSIAAHFRRHMQGEVRFDETSRKLYSTDASIYQIKPIGVVVPRTVQDIVRAVQMCGEHGIAITSRGGGTSLSGQSIGAGIVLDCAKYLHHVLEVDVARRRARVQPGVVLDQLNRHVALSGLQFGPEVATANRACLGGMIGNNSAGSRSLVYGKTIDHVAALNVVLSTGELYRAAAMSQAEWAQRASLDSFAGRIHREVQSICMSHRGEIENRFPNIIRRVSGYNLDRMAKSFDEPARQVSMTDLLVGSEGTLGITTEAELNLIPRPKYRGLLVPHFRSLDSAMLAVAACLDAQPTAVELLDSMFVRLARANLSLKDQLRAIVGLPDALLMVEFCSDDPGEVLSRVEKLHKRLHGVEGVGAIVKATDPALYEPLWNLRNSSVPLLYGIPGDRKPVTFVEDTAVSPEKLPEFVRRFRAVLHRHGTDGAFYGHASVGCLHIRPLLDLKQSEGRKSMVGIMDDITDLVLEFGGSLSGEHGDGLVRSHYNRKMFGDEIYQAFCDLKAAFDPSNLLNPGKIVHAPTLLENLRFSEEYRTASGSLAFDYTRQESHAKSIELCNGAGACRKMQGGAMCPSYRVTRNERDSTRGRANALRLAISAADPEKELGSKWLHEVLDLCLSCKACKSECPSNVDLAKLKAEFLEHYYRHRVRPISHRLLANVHRLYPLGAPVATWANRMQNLPIAKWLLHHAAGIDARRSLPPLHRNHLRAWFPNHERHANAGKMGRVILLDDCFTTYTEPHVGIAAVQLLERAGYEVELAGGICCGRAMISKGYLNDAKGLVRRAVPSLAKRVSERTPILGVEPSCLLALVDEWPDLVPGPATKHIAQHAELVDIWLGKQVMDGKTPLRFDQRQEHCLVHVHCHQRAWRGVSGTMRALGLVPGLAAEEMDAGCCGMAGSFGYETDHYDLSVQVAGLQLLPKLRSNPTATVIAPGTSCRHQIHDLVGRRALHPVEVLELASRPGHSSTKLPTLQRSQSK